jgi:hypothetical protein
VSLASFVVFDGFLHAPAQKKSNPDRQGGDRSRSEQILDATPCCNRVKLLASSGEKDPG